MGNFIVGAIILLIVLYVILSLRREHKKYGSCAYCSYAHAGHCDHVGHRELDGEDHEIKLTKEQQAIIDRHSRKRPLKG